MRWTHKPTFPLNQDIDRTVYADGRCVARIYQIMHGPSEGKWAFFPNWPVSSDFTFISSPDAETLELALETVRTLYLEQTENK